MSVAAMPELRNAAPSIAMGERLWATAVWTLVGFFLINLIAMIATVVASSFSMTCCL